MKRLAAIILSALILFSFAACDFFGNGDETEISSLIGSIPEESESTESNKGTGGSDESDSTESGKYSFISQEEKNTWRNDLIAVLSKPRVHEFEPYCPGSISVGLMDINFDNSPEVLVAYAGGSMHNIYIEIYDLKSDGEPITYDGACYGNYYNICLYVADNDGEFVILSEGSLRIPETGWVTYICSEQIDSESQALGSNILFEIASDLKLYACNGQVVDEAEYEAIYQQFLLDYKKIESTQIQMMRWSDIGEVEKREPQTKSSTPVYTREEIAEKMADALINSSQKFIKYDISDNAETNEELTDTQETESTETETACDVIPAEYTSIIEAYVKMATYKNETNSVEGINSWDYPELSQENFVALRNHTQKYNSYGMGYFLHDTNHDSTSELIFSFWGGGYLSQYCIYMVFTLNDNKAQLVGSFEDDIYNSDPNDVLLGEDGNIHCLLSSGYEFTHSIISFDQTGITERFSYKIIDPSATSDNKTEWLKEENGEWINITEEEFSILQSKYEFTEVSIKFDFHYFFEFAPK